MRRTTLLLSLAACLALAGSTLRAQDAPAQDDRKVAKEAKQVQAEGAKLSAEEKQAKAAAKKEAARLGDIGMKMDKVVAFSDEQKARLAELNKKREAALKELNDRFVKDALALMTPEQRAAWEQATKEGQPKDGQGKEGKVKDGQPKEVRAKEGKAKGDAAPEGGEAP